MNEGQVDFLCTVENASNNGMVFCRRTETCTVTHTSQSDTVFTICSLKVCHKSWMNVIAAL